MSTVGDHSACLWEPGQAGRAAGDRLPVVDEEHVTSHILLFDTRGPLAQERG